MSTKRHKIILERVIDRDGRVRGYGWYCVRCGNCGPTDSWWGAFWDSIFYRVNGICRPASTTGSEQTDGA